MRAFKLLLVLTVPLLFACVAGCRENVAELRPQAVSVVNILVIDDQGSPVAGALLGKGAGRLAADGPEWKFAGTWDPNQANFVPLITDEDGHAEIDRALAHSSGVLLFSRHVERRLAGVLPLSKEDLDAAAKTRAPVTLRLVPECRVTGQAYSSDLEKLGRPLKYVDANARLDDRSVCYLSAEGTSYELFIPPGEFELVVSGLDCPRVTTELVVPAGVSELEVPPIDLPASPLVFLVGKPAPEFTGINEWKDSEPLKLADLRGRFVLLKFGAIGAVPACITCPRSWPCVTNTHMLSWQSSACMWITRLKTRSTQSRRSM